MSFSLFSKIGLTQLVGFTRQLATMINAGLPLVEALTLIKEQTQGRLADLVSGILDEIEGGGSLSRALAKHEKIFGSEYIASIKAGEEAGVLEKVLLRLADNLEKKRSF